MIRNALLLCVISAGLTMPCYAQESKDPDDMYSLMKQAVEYSTKSDAYNAYCDEPSSLSSNFLDKFTQREDLTIEQKGELVSIMEKTVKDFKQWFQKDHPKCEEIEFMLGRLEIMRKLKDVSYLLNGVDPATLPKDNIPELEKLMPQKRK